MLNDCIFHDVLQNKVQQLLHNRRSDRRWSSLYSRERAHKQARTLVSRKKTTHSTLFVKQCFLCRPQPQLPSPFLTSDPYRWFVLFFALSLLLSVFTANVSNIHKKQGPAFVWSDFLDASFDWWARDSTARASLSRCVGVAEIV